MKTFNLRYKALIITAKVSVAFWIIETIYFLFKEGWHWTASSKAEITCDTIVSIGFVTVAVLFSSLVADVLTWFYKQLNK